MRVIQRRSTPGVRIGSVMMGAEYPIVVQSMTNTPTADVSATVAQVKQLADAGSELVRLTVNDFEAMAAVPDIVARLADMGCTVPLVGDFHFNGHILLTKYPDGAAALSKYRINPGNVGKGAGRDDNFADMIRVANDFNKPVRIGVNWGSLDQDLFTTMMDENARLSEPKSFKDVVYDAMVFSAVRNAELAQHLGMSKDRVVISTKMSEVQDMIQVYERLAKETDCVLHLGLTEAGGGIKGVASSAAALAVLLQQGIGDTIRISLTPEPGVSRDAEVKACKAVLQSMGFRYFMPSVTSCPGCGRTNSNKFVHLAKDVTEYIEQRMPDWRSKYVGVEKLTVAVMGCVVNGPGESKYADIGISLP
ncbi:flavodoxin-dependent (E)-4-hydroxy-3-methylbut-2-enyl-diphosphate synthase, partial [bacterium]|nr:flavodoxin-dependent (E)-4-hydroxy-3-methylbut-2-enyl-diphosphate synthase [bacterium]